MRGQQYYDGAARGNDKAKMAEAGDPDRVVPGDNAQNWRRGYSRQFTYLLSAQDSIRHPGIVFRIGVSAGQKKQLLLASPDTAIRAGCDTYCVLWATVVSSFGTKQ